MRTFTPIVISNGNGIAYPKLDAEKSIEFGNRFKKRSPEIKVIFETESWNGATEQLTLEKLTELNTF